MAFYEQASDLGEVNQNGLRYHLYYDAERHITISVLIPGQLSNGGAGEQ